MSFGGTASGGDEVTFQLAPMIDVVFQLLIFFLLATSFQKFEAKLDSDLPQQQEEPETPPKQYIVKVTRDGLLVNDQKMSKSGFMNLILEVIQYDPNQYVFIDGQDDAIYRDVIEIFDELNRNNVNVTVIPPYEK